MDTPVSLTVGFHTRKSNVLHLVRVHMTLQTTPAWSAALTDCAWTWEELMTFRLPPSHPRQWRVDCVVIVFLEETDRSPTWEADEKHRMRECVKGRGMAPPGKRLPLPLSDPQSDALMRWPSS